MFSRVHYNSCIYIRSKNMLLCRRAPPGISSENNILMYIRTLSLLPHFSFSPIPTLFPSKFFFFFHPLLALYLILSLYLSLPIFFFVHSIFIYITVFTSLAFLLCSFLFFFFFCFNIFFILSLFGTFVLFAFF